MNRNRTPLWCLAMLVCVFLVPLLTGVALVGMAPRPQSTHRVNPCVDLDDRDYERCNAGEDEEGVLPDVLEPVIIEQLQSQAALTTAAMDGILYKGITLAGGEILDSQSKDGRYVPDDNDAHLFLYKGMNTFRVPIRWENIAIRTGLLVSNDYIMEVDRLVANLLAKNASVILVLYNDMRYNGATLPTEDNIFQLWTNLVTRYPLPRIVYSTMNEESANGDDAAIKRYNQVAITAIRNIETILGLRNHLVLISGVDSNRLERWTSSRNYLRVVGFSDPAEKDNYAVVVHQYLNRSTTNECLSIEVFRRIYRPVFDEFVSWMRTNSQRVFIGEIYAIDSQNCRDALAEFLVLLQSIAYTQELGYGVIGWTTWTAGKRWDGLYPFAMGAGNRANLLLWHPNLYQRYLPRRDVPVLREERRALRLRNTSPQAVLIYLDGYVPFQFIGSANLGNLEANNTFYLYSNSQRLSPLPTANIRARYTTLDRNTVITIGLIETSSGSAEFQVEQSVINRDNTLPSLRLTVDDDCDLSFVFTRNTPDGQPSCYRIVST